MEEDKNAFMKKLISLFLFFAFVNLFSQEYHFDYSIESQINRIKPNKENTISTSFYDSKNKISLNLTRYNEKLRAIIYDEQKKLRHSFKVTEAKGFVTFEYTHTNDFSKEKKGHRDNEDILEVNQIDSLQYQITAFKNEKKTKKRFTALVTLEHSKFDYLEIHVDHAKCDEMMEKVRKFLNPNFIYSVKKISLNYHSTGYSYDDLLKIQNVDFSLRVPDKLIIKEFDFLGEFQ